MVVVVRELRQQMIQMPLSENDELVEAFQLDRLDEAFATTIQVGTGLR